jgi:hypothetical protein
MNRLQAPEAVLKRGLYPRVLEPLVEDRYQELYSEIFAADERVRYATVTDSYRSIPAGRMRPSVVL